LIGQLLIINTAFWTVLWRGNSTFLIPATLGTLFLSRSTIRPSTLQSTKPFSVIRIWYDQTSQSVLEESQAT